MGIRGGIEKIFYNWKGYKKSFKMGREVIKIRELEFFERKKLLCGIKSTKKSLSFGDRLKWMDDLKRGGIRSHSKLSGIALSITKPK